MHGDVRAITIGGDPSLAVAATDTIYTDSFKLKQGTAFGLWILAAGTTVNLKIQLEQSWTTPTTENAADTTNYAIPKGFADIESALAIKTPDILSISPIPMTYARFKITGNATNHADVTLQMKIFIQDTIL